MSMVPTYKEAIALWKKFQLPEQKQRHCLLVARLAMFLADRLGKQKQIPVHKHTLLAAALLHDIDKNILHKEGERHPDTGVRVLRELGMDEVAQLVRTHPLHAILDETIMPKSWEEKILFLSDKMVKYDFITVEERFLLWEQEHLPKKEQDLLTASFPKVKQLEQVMCTTLGLTPLEMIQLAKQSILKDEGGMV